MIRPRHPGRLVLIAGGFVLAEGAGVLLLAAEDAVHSLGLVPKG